MLLATSILRFGAIALVVLGASGVFTARKAKAEPAACTAQDFATAIDKSGSALRALTLKEQPKLQERIRRYVAAKGIDAGGGEDAALDAIQDDRLKVLNEKSSSLLLEIDALGRIDEGAPIDCGKLKVIEGLSGSLMQVMREKSSYMLARLDAAIAAEGGSKPREAASGAAPAPQKTAPEKKTAPLAKTPPATAPVREKVAATGEGGGGEKQPKPAQNDAYSPANQGPAPGAPLPPTALSSSPDASADAFMPDDAQGYSIEEIRDATKGFFGTISTNLATVIEHAFKTSGRPTAYVLGTEGGGAFFAGLRFGEGTLFMRHQSFSRQVYWHGPSLGTDFGAAGSRTLFLIYKLHQPDQLYRTFSGVDGSAYLVGGVGLTLLKGGDVIMAPIRSGLGIRFGANIGYLRFSDHSTWNPF